MLPANRCALQTYYLDSFMGMSMYDFRFLFVCARMRVCVCACVQNMFICVEARVDNSLPY